MASVSQMSSRKPPVGQSTFGFPDDPPRSADFSPQPDSSAPRLSVGVLTPPAPLPCTLLRTIRSLREALSSPVLWLCELRGRPSSSRKNVEKLSFHPRNPERTANRKKLFHPPFQHFPPPKTVQLSSHLCGLRALVRSKKCVKLPPSLFLGVFVRFVGDQKNVEKLSFQARVFSILLEPEKSFPPLQSAFV